MRKLIAGLALLSALGGTAFAQDATLSSPVARSSEAKYKIRSFNAVTIGTNSVQIDVSVQDASNNEIRVASFTVPDAAHPGATFTGLITAMMTVRATETGVDPRKMAFRVLGYLFDNGYLGGTSLNP
jgi:hypothetical protein